MKSGVFKRLIWYRCVATIIVQQPQLSICCHGYRSDGTIIVHRLSLSFAADDYRSTGRRPRARLRHSKGHVSLYSVSLDGVPEPFRAISRPIVRRTTVSSQGHRYHSDRTTIVDFGPITMDGANYRSIWRFSSRRRAQKTQ